MNRCEWCLRYFGSKWPARWCSHPCRQRGWFFEKWLREDVDRAESMYWRRWRREQRPRRLVVDTGPTPPHQRLFISDDWRRPRERAA